MYNYPYSLIVIDGDKVPATKQSCIAYMADNAIKNRDKADYYLEAVEDFFEDAGIEVEPEVVEKIADSVFHKGFCFWDGFQFEMLIK